MEANVVSLYGQDEFSCLVTNVLNMVKVLCVAYNKNIFRMILRCSAVIEAIIDPLDDGQTRPIWKDVSTLRPDLPYLQLR